MLTRGEGVRKAIAAEKLIGFLRQCPPGSLVAVSPVGDLLVLGADEKPRGIISLADEQYEPDAYGDAG